MKLNFNIPILDLEDKEVDNSNIGKTIANALHQSRTGDALKYWDWAKKLYKGEPLDLDPSDVQTLKNFILTDENFFVILRAQALAVFDEKPAPKK
jgi:hypothetical protein